MHLYAQCTCLNYVMKFTCNMSHYNKEFDLKGQCVDIVYLSEATQIHYVIKVIQ